MRLRIVAAVAVAGLALAACGAGGGEPADTAAGNTACEPGAAPTLTDGVLAVGTGTPYEPWFVGEDQTTGEGFESALVYAVAEQLGYEHEDVQWQVLTFEQLIAPSDKPFDFAAYQTSITDERRQAVDFSSPYLFSKQGVVVADGSALDGATALADFNGLRVGVTATQTSYTISQNAWGEDVELVPFDDAGLAMQALSAGQIDAVVMDVNQAVAATTVYYPDTTITGTLPSGDIVEQIGFVLDLDSPLTPCVSAAVQALEADGTLAQLREQWLDTDGIEELS